MAETQSLSVLLQLKDQLSAQMGQVTGTVQDLNKELNALSQGGEAASAGLGNTAKAASSAKQSMRSFGDGIIDVEKKQVKLALKLATMATKMAAVSMISSELGSTMSGKLGKGVESAVGALGKFAMISMTIPGPLGIVIGAAVGLASAWKAVSHAADETNEKMKGLNERIQANIKLVNTFSAKRDVAADLSTPEEQFKTSVSDQRQSAETLRKIYQNATSKKDLSEKDLGANTAARDRQYAKVREEQIQNQKRGPVISEGGEDLGIQALLKEEAILRDINTERAHYARIHKNATAEAKKASEDYEVVLDNIFQMEKKHREEAAKASIGNASMNFAYQKAKVEEDLASGKISQFSADEKIIEIETKKLETLQAEMSDVDELNGKYEDQKNLLEEIKSLHEADVRILDEEKSQLEEYANIERTRLHEKSAMKSDQRALKDAGFDSSVESVQKLREEAEKADVSIHEIIVTMSAARDKDFFGGMAMGIRDVSDSLLNFRSIFGNVFSGIQGGMSNAFEEAIGNVHKWKDAMTGFADSMKKTFIKAIAEMASQAVMKQLLGGFGAIFGGSGAPGGQRSGGGNTGPGGRPSGMSSLAGGIGVGAIAGGFSGESAGNGSGGEAGGYSGLAGGDFSGVAGGLVGGAAGISGVMGAKNAGQGAMSGAMAGAALGTMIFPGIGTVIGLAVGAIAGAIMGSRNKRRLKRAKKRAEAYARSVHMAQANEAAQLFKTATRTRMGGALALPEATDEISKLFSGDVTGQEMIDMGPGVVESILGQKQAINAQAANSAITVGAPIINVQVGSIASSYDAQKLAEDLGFHLTASIQSAAAG